MAPTQRALEEAVNALYRIRAVEQPPSPEGLRTIWHQCAKGADLASYVDNEGRLVQQELTLLDDFFRWTSAKGLVTGAVADRPGSKAASPSADILLDGQIDPGRVIRAAAALRGYQGDDRYIRNVRRILQMVAEGVQSFDEVTVTKAAARAATSTAPRPRGKFIAWAAAGALVALGAGAGIALWLR